MTTDSEGVLRFVSGAVLFPQRWSLIEKIGMDMRCALAPADLRRQSVHCSAMFPQGPCWSSDSLKRQVCVLIRRRIHDPVPIFNKEILKPVSAFMNRITPTRPFWRANWTVCAPAALLACGDWVLASGVLHARVRLA